MLDGVIVYVGESKNVYSRIGAHVKDSKKRFDTVRLLPCQEHRRKYWEAVLIDRYQPLFNSKGKNKETNQRHIFELGQIRKRHMRTHTDFETHAMQLNEAYRGRNVAVGCMAPITSAVTSNGSIFIDTTRASNKDYSNLAKEEANHREESKPKTIRIKVEHEIKALNGLIERLGRMDSVRRGKLKKRIEEIKDREYVDIPIPPKDIVHEQDIFRITNSYNVSTSIRDPESLKRLFAIA